MDRTGVAGKLFDLKHVLPQKIHTQTQQKMAETAPNKKNIHKVVDCGVFLFVKVSRTIGVLVKDVVFRGMLHIIVISIFVFNNIFKFGDIWYFSSGVSVITAGA